jgi:hypothetical protein
VFVCVGYISEHRNIPVEDAFALLSSSLQRYQQQQQGGIGGGGGGGRGGVEQRSGGGGGGGGGLMDSAAPDSRGRGGMQMQAGPEPHHANMQGLINLLQENRPLSVMEYDRLIRYLSDRRDRQMAEDARGGGGLAGSQPAYLLGNLAKKKNNIFLCCLNNNQLINYWNCFTCQAEDTILAELLRAAVVVVVKTIRWNCSRGY